MSEIICPYCGSSNDIDALTCLSCKKPLYDDVEVPDNAPQQDGMDWLNTFRGFDTETNASTSTAEPGSESADAEPEIPEWLARIRALKGDEAPPLEEEEPLPPEEIPSLLEQDADLPDWIKEIKASDAPQSGEENNEDFPDWLKDLSDEENPTPEPEVSVGSGMVLPDIPDDLSLDEAAELNFNSQSEGTGPSEPVSLPTDTGELPDEFFRDIIAGQTQSAEEIDQPDLDWLDERADSNFPQGEPTAQPLDELDGQSLPTLEQPEPAPSAAETEPVESPELPEWMFESGEPAGNETAEPTEIDFAPVEDNLAGTSSEDLITAPQEAELPDWLLEDEAAPPAQGPEYLPEAPSDLEAGQMPGWLHAVRPIEAAAPNLVASEEESRIEASGPLAGYQGVLPGQGVVTHYSKPPVYSARMQVTDKQRIYATLFESLIADETRVGAPAAAKTKSSQLVMRLVVGLVMVVALLAILILQPGFAAFPTLVPPESVAFYDSVQTLTSAATPPRVLVALDYDPSLSGELRTISTSVVEDWMAGNSGLAFISLSPTGPALVSELVNAAAAQNPAYLTAERVINLGYLPGGASALAALAINPTRAAPTTMDGLPAWESLLLQGMTAVADFDAILLLTDNAENSRAWVEQVKPAAGDTPLLVISSAQVAPALQPYVQSGQISGMVSGFTGGAAYEQLTQSANGPVRRYWDAYQGGMLLIAALMLIGAAAFGIKKFVRRPK
ncbi:MAG: ICP22 family protein [Bellilinea sp.]